ncbi:sigma-70 family RNA polymerase sigma factor [Bacillus toyonensis]|uniref:sigma-70 family RNA polymerase sigma factor n=1 Tax=Bacillus toyonensis TaxID=155322 RepID=UPI002E1C21AE|nr:sigma-70 family RNA polymerase sigma factor [Bacillus toyonensis]
MTKSALTTMLEDIAKYDLLTAEEERDYLQKAQRGDIDARDILIQHYLKLVVNVAKKYKNRGVDLEDLIQEGTVGLIDAIQHYDSASEYKFK